jgi:SAM-dependent methyltransferase
MDLYTDHAWLYDCAFDWDIEAEVEWLIAGLGGDVRRILEPACGPGRMFPPFARRGVEVVGIDLSAQMLDLARAKMEAAGLPEPTLHRLPIEDFDLGVEFDGAICPINTLGYLPSEELLARHLECVARHLPRGRRYFVQLDLRCFETLAPIDPGDVGRWEFDHERGRVRVDWFGREVDRQARTEIQVSRFTFLSGPDEGLVLEDEHVNFVWNWDRWSGLVSASPFRQAGAWDGNSTGREPVEMGVFLEDRPLTWHELIRL